jgi:uncharacterized membrane protein YhaH (DUF805 family)
MDLRTINLDIILMCIRYYKYKQFYKKQRNKIMKCSNCQNEVNENDRFCSKCGTPVTLLSANASDFTYSIPIPPEENTTSDEQTYDPKTHSQKVNRNIFTYKGRMNRLRFFGTGFLVNIISLVLILLWGIIAFAISGKDGSLYLSGVIIINVVDNIILSFLAAKRFHDLNISGWWALVLFIPNLLQSSGKYVIFFTIFAIINLIVLLFLLFKKGTKGPNRFGLDPLEK